MMNERKEWEGFTGRLWKEEINVRDFIQNNYKPYDGDESFLAEPTEATNKLWQEVPEERRRKNAQRTVFSIWKQKSFPL